MTKALTIDEQLKPLETEIVTQKQKAEALEIKTDADYDLATEAVKFVTDRKKAIEDTRKFFVDPLNKQVKDINARFKPQADEADEVIKIIKGKMSVYFSKKEEARLKEEKRLQDIRDKANAKREAEGKEMIAEPVREVAEVSRTVSTGAAQSTVKKVWKHKIISMSELPDDVKKAIFAEAYKKGLVDTVVGKFVKAGVREMTGVEIYQDTQIAIR